MLYGSSIVADVLSKDQGESKPLVRKTTVLYLDYIHRGHADILT